MKPIYVFAIIGVLFVLFVESSKSTSANNVLIAQANANAAAANAAAGDSDAAIIGASIAGVGSLADDFSGFGLD